MGRRKSVRHTGNWRGRSLENYKEIHRETAERKGVLEAFLRAETLTQAKKILRGERVR